MNDSYETQKAKHRAARHRAEETMSNPLAEELRSLATVYPPSVATPYLRAADTIELLERELAEARAALDPAAAKVAVAYIAKLEAENAALRELQREDARNIAFDEAAVMLDRQAVHAAPPIAALVKQLAEAVRQMKTQSSESGSK